MAADALRYEIAGMHQCVKRYRLALSKAVAGRCADPGDQGGAGLSVYLMGYGGLLMTQYAPSLNYEYLADLAEEMAKRVRSSDSARLNQAHWLQELLASFSL